MKTLEVAQATTPLADYAEDVKNEPLILTINGKPIAALIPLENVDLETVTLSTHPQFLALIERSRTRQKTGGGISSEEMRRRLGQ
jgi:antitoxin (DNA-binding transcriptional repressor) of toxin-antitoxin stability system